MLSWSGSWGHRNKWRPEEPKRAVCSVQGVDAVLASQMVGQLVETMAQGMDFRDTEP